MDISIILPLFSLRQFRGKEIIKKNKWRRKKMKTKIVGILVCMLLIATAIPAVGSLKNSTIKPTAQNCSLTRMTLVANTDPTIVSPKNSAINERVSSQLLASIEGNWIETQKLLASDGAANDHFSEYAVALDDNTALIGAYYDDDKGANSGSVYVFTRTGTTWTEQQKLLAIDGAAGDNFGVSVTLSGDTAIIGAPGDENLTGSAYVFTRTGTTWTQQAKLTAPDGVPDAFFGYPVSLSGDTIMIGANQDDDNGYWSGSVYVFIRTGTTWTQQAKLIASDGGVEDGFGYGISLVGDTALIGAIWDNDYGNHSGSAYVFTRTGTNWTQQQKLLPSDGVTDAQFGISVSLDGNTALIGANRDDDNGLRSGSAYVFTRTGTTWTQEAKLIASDGATEERFGIDVALEGDTALIGSETPDNGDNSGSVYVFTGTGNTWTEGQKLLASDGASVDWFGFSIALDGDTALFAASQDDDNGFNSGSAYIFTRSHLTFDTTGGLGVKAVIKNNGTSDVTDIPWQIHVEGGMLGMINKTVNGTVDIPAGKSVTVKTGMLLGFGAISIVARVADEEQTATGTQIIIFSMVPK
jgi:hypothetical protein